MYVYIYIILYTYTEISRFVLLHHISNFSDEDHSTFTWNRHYNLVIHSQISLSSMTFQLINPMNIPFFRWQAHFHQGSLRSSTSSTTWQRPMILPLPIPQSWRSRWLKMLTTSTGACLGCATPLGDEPTKMGHNLKTVLWKRGIQWGHAPGIKGGTYSHWRFLMGKPVLMGHCHVPLQQGIHGYPYSHSHPQKKEFGNFKETLIDDYIIILK